MSGIRCGGWNCGKEGYRTWFGNKDESHSLILTGQWCVAIEGMDVLQTTGSMWDGGKGNCIKL